MLYFQDQENSHLIKLLFFLHAGEQLVAMVGDGWCGRRGRRRRFFLETKQKTKKIIKNCGGKIDNKKIVKETKKDKTKHTKKDGFSF